jgi:hypothetical protein
MLPPKLTMSSRMPARNVGAPESDPQQHGSPTYRVEVLARYHPQLVSSPQFGIGLSRRG